MATRWPRTSSLAILRGAAMDESESSSGQTRPGVWPSTLPSNLPVATETIDLEREGDREYIAPEVLSGKYGKEADIFR